ncbi:ABC-type sugar transport system ATPase subunit [Rhodopseudomonas rhenobacensis]|uniref:ABC-type sugar transport system ATPase subunit n=1 Tax=Rhodopseudomonas rhenobacensis TaxID=87461 RepID=A0A7W8E1K7_9BRAD|nr:sugar ABC transporter ATP-binding protein [Rhodopseudomonas rhenobacensis]MBB5048996.1 ABC-type sugar transport system ATPase subunit [Rhodopseudomonas rhenobacensis]
MLSVNRISKSFAQGQVAALQDVSLSLKQGEIRAICGENGAGKSTLVKILMGIQRPDTGTIHVDGRPAEFLSPRDAQDAGFAQVAQELSIVPSLSVLDNIWLGSNRVPVFHRRREFRDKAQAALSRIGAGHIELDALAGDLSIGQCQMIEIARLLVGDARLLILDEPTATLSDTEIANIFAAIRALKAEGRSVIYITHRLGEVFSICDSVTVLRNGRHIVTMPVGDCDREHLIELMLGRSFEDMYRHQPNETFHEAALSVANLSVPGLVHDLSMTLPRGRLVCIAGQVGSGAHHVLRALAGLSIATGEVSVGGTPMRLNSAAVSRAHNIHFISEDRAAEGIFARMRVLDNVVATRLPLLGWFGLISRSRLRNAAKSLLAQVGVDKTRLDSEIGQLSGGNQQKVLFGRAMGQAPGILLMNEPTRGVDVGARADIYQMMRSFCDQGFGLVMTSTDLEEIVGVADIVITLYRGKFVRRYEGAAITMKDILADITHPPDQASPPAMAISGVTAS